MSDSRAEGRSLLTKLTLGHFLLTKTPVRANLRKTKTEKNVLKVKVNIGLSCYARCPSIVNYLKETLGEHNIYVMLPNVSLK